jgi:hypothetical protein
MKKTISIAIGALLLLCSTSLVAQSLGDYARQARKDKAQTATAEHHYDNDNLPTGTQLSIVGPAAATTGNGAAAAPAGLTPQEQAAKATKQQADADLQMKIQDLKQKLDDLTHQFDLDQREYRLRAAAFYADAGVRLRNSAQWDKEDAAYKADMEAKQKAIDDTKQRLEGLQEQARKSGLREADADKSAEKNKEGDKDKEK